MGDVVQGSFGSTVGLGDLGLECEWGRVGVTGRDSGVAHLKMQIVVHCHFSSIWDIHDFGTSFPGHWLHWNIRDFHMQPRATCSSGKSQQAGSYPQRCLVGRLQVRSTVGLVVECSLTLLVEHSCQSPDMDSISLLSTVPFCLFQATRLWNAVCFLFLQSLDASCVLTQLHVLAGLQEVRSGFRA